MSLRDWLRGVFGGSDADADADASCLSCNSTDLESLAPDAYRCGTCGYEGGDGLAAWIAERKRSEIAAMSPEQRSALARENLSAARNVLVGAAHIDGDSLYQNRPETILPPEVHLALGLELNAGAERIAEEERIAGARFRELMESERLLEQAALALAEPFAIPPSLRLTTTELQLDDPYVQGMLTEIVDVQRHELERLERVARS
jgi:hypothetical protein